MVADDIKIIKSYNKDKNERFQKGEKMKFFKRSYLFIALTLLSVVSNSHAMMTPWSSTIAMVTGSVDLIGSILLGKNAWNALWQSPFPLKNLPKEIQDLIIGLIITGTTSNDLTQAGQAINSLAQVNKELNQLINNPKYSASLIKNLAVQFDATEESVCKALQTLSAKE